MDRESEYYCQKRGAGHYPKRFDKVVKNNACSKGGRRNKVRFFIPRIDFENEIVRKQNRYERRKNGAQDIQKGSVLLYRKIDCKKGPQKSENGSGKPSFYPGKDIQKRYRRRVNIQKCCCDS